MGLLPQTSKEYGYGKSDKTGEKDNLAQGK